MARIRTETPKVSQTQQKLQQPDAQDVARQQLQAKIDAGKQLVDRSIDNDNNFSQKEAKALADAVAADPAIKAAVAQHLTARLEEKKQAGAQVSISDMALSRLTGALGLDFKGLFFERQQQSAKTDQQVTALDKTAKSTATEHDAGAHRQASDTRLDMQKELNAGRSGDPVQRNAITPEGKAAKVVASEVFGAVNGKVDEKLAQKAPGLKAAKDAVTPHLVDLSQRTIEELAKDPDAWANVTGILSKIGKDGWKAASATAMKDLSHAFTNATGTAAKNPEAIAATVNATKNLADKLPALAKATGNPQLIAAVEKSAPQLAGTATKLGARFGVQGAATAGKALPVIGNIICVGSAITSGVTALLQLTKRPFDGKKVANEGAYFLTQLGGVWFPWIGLGGTVAKAGTDAAIKHSDDKKRAAGEVVTEQASLGEAFHFLRHAADIAEPALAGAGNADGAAKMRALRELSDKLQGADKLTPEQLDELHGAQKGALSALVDTLHGKFQQTADEQKREAPGSFGHAVAFLGGHALHLASTAMKKNAVMEKQRNMPGAEPNPKAEATKRAQHSAEVVAALGPAAAAQGAADHA